MESEDTNKDTDLNLPQQEPKRESNKFGNNINNNINISTPNQEESKNEDKDKEETQVNSHIAQVNNYINENQQNNKYKEIMKNNPEKIFSFLNEKVFILWQSILFNSDLTIIESDEVIITNTLDRKDQHLIEVDTKRTRVIESPLVVGFKKYLELILTYYTNTKNIHYKQGLNEIFGPLILMKYKIKQLKLVNIFNFGEAFIDKFLPNYYYEEGLCSLKSSLSLFVLLLKYHEPSVYNLLDSLEIPHELYAPNWLLTLRSGKLNLDILYYFWGKLIEINDPLFIHFILVALIINYRVLLINCDSNLLLKLMTALTITSIEELNHIIQIALELRKNTPYSFRLLANKLGFLKTNNNSIDYTFEKYKPESIPTMPVYPLEIILQNKNTKKFVCSDKECKNYLKDKIIIDWDNNLIKENNKFSDTNHVCEKCDMNIDKKINFILLDLRVFPPSYFNSEDDYFKLGCVSGMMSIGKEDLESNDIDKILSSHLLEVRGIKHIVLMTSKTDYFKEFEENFYMSNTNEIEKRKMLYGMIENQKVEKQLDLSDSKNLNLEKIYKLKEYDNLRKVMNSMKQKNFPYVGYLEGGFEALHDECLNNKIELVGHDNDNCIICKNNTKKIKENKFKWIHNKEKEISTISNSLWKNKKKLTAYQLDSFFINKDNIVLFCFLRRYKTKTYHKKDFELFVAILFEKKCVKIYKKENKIENYNYEKNQEKFNNPNYYNLGIKKDKNDNDFELTLIEQVKFKDLLKVGFNHESKNIIIMEVKNENIEKKDKFFLLNLVKKEIINKNKEKKEDSFIIEIEFDTINDSKLFMKSIKQI